MIKIKKLATTILMLSAGYVNAGTMGPVCQSTSLSLPCDVHEWSVGGQAIYMQMPTSNNFSESDLTGTNGSINRGGVPGWNWGFQLEAARAFQNGKDLDVNWYHLRGSRAGALNAPVYLGSVFLPQDPSGIFSPISDSNVTITDFSSQVNTGWDMVNIEHGRHIDFDEEFYARVHFGGEYSRVAQNTQINNAGTKGVSPAVFSLDTNVESVYNGFGPRLGLDLMYETHSGLGFYGKGAVGLLAGTAKTNYRQINTSGEVSGYYLNVNKVVTSTDAKLGINYIHDLFHGSLDLDLGWMWVNYLNPLSAKSTVSGSENNSFGIQGLYFGAKWTGDMV